MRLGRERHQKTYICSIEKNISTSKKKHDNKFIKKESKAGMEELRQEERKEGRKEGMEE